MLGVNCDSCVYLEADKEIINQHIEKEIILERRIKKLEEKNKLLEKWQIKSTEAVCLTNLVCRYQKVFKNN